MSSTAKGKVGTKGQKQIYEENRETLLFYGGFALLGWAVWGLAAVFLFAQPPARWDSWWMGLSVAGQAGALLCMRSMAKASRGDKGQLLDAGLDLNHSGGFGEYCKDVVILASICQVLGAVWWWGWLVGLAGPAFALWKLWALVLAPWFFAEAPEESQEDLKRRAKKDRKVKRI